MQVAVIALVASDHADVPAAGYIYRDRDEGGIVAGVQIIV